MVTHWATKKSSEFFRSFFWPPPAEKNLVKLRTVCVKLKSNGNRVDRYAVKLTQGLVFSLQSQYSWTIPNRAWTHRRNYFKGDPEELVRLFHSDRLRQETLEKAGHCSPTWTVLRSLQKVYGAKRIRGCTIIDANDFGNDVPKDECRVHLEGPEKEWWSGTDLCLLREYQFPGHVTSSDDSVGTESMGAGFVCLDRSKCGIEILRHTPDHEDLLTTTDSEVLCQLVGRWVGQSFFRQHDRCRHFGIYSGEVGEETDESHLLTESHLFPRCFRTTTGSRVNEKKAHGAGLFDMNQGEEWRNLC